MTPTPGEPIVRIAALAAWVLIAAGGRAESPAVEAARAREARFRSCAVEFTLAETVTHWVRPNEPQLQTTFTRSFRLVLDEGRGRVESSWVGPPPPKFNFIPPPAVAVFDGELTRVLYPDGIGRNGPAEGIIDPSPRADMIHTLVPPVVSQFLRPLDPALSPYPAPLDRFNPTGASKSINGVECVEYTCPAGPETVHTYWLAPARDHVAVRHERRHQNRLTDETDVAHRRDADLGWVPESWTTKHTTETGAVSRTATGTVTRWRLGIGFAAGPLDLPFPEGTSVFDRRVNKYYRVQADGSRRELDEMGNEIVEPVERPWYRKYAWAGAVAVVAGAVVAGRVRRRQGVRKS
jgi:hypothetical protein